MTRGGVLIILGMLLTMLTIIAFVILLIPDYTIDAQIKETESGVVYKLFYIDGMPCIYVTEGAGNAKTGGPSCDWSRWHGE